MISWPDPAIHPAPPPGEQADVGTNRATASLAKLQELNTSVKVHAVAGPVTEELLAKHTVVVLVGSTLDEAVKWNAFCRVQSPPIKVHTPGSHLQFANRLSAPYFPSDPGATHWFPGGRARISTHRIGPN